MKEFHTVDEVLDFAIAREMGSHRLYIQLAQWAERPEAAELFEQLAADEMQHRIRLEAIKAGDVKIERQKVLQEVAQINRTVGNYLKVCLDPAPIGYKSRAFGKYCTRSVTV